MLNNRQLRAATKAGWEALQAVLTNWRGGRRSWEHWEPSTQGARALFVEPVHDDVGPVLRDRAGDGICRLHAQDAARPVLSANSP